MKTQLILLAEPILVTDEEILKDDFCYNPITKEFFKVPDENYINGLNKNTDDYKVIAGVPELPSICYSDEALEVLEKKYGWVDVDKLVLEKLKKTTYITYNMEIEAWVEGFKTCQSLNKKKFSEADVLLAIDLARLQGEESFLVKYGEEEILERISKPKVIDVEVEMKCAYGDNCPSKGAYDKQHLCKIQPKITNNSIKVIKVL